MLLFVFTSSSTTSSQTVWAVLFVLDWSSCFGMSLSVRPFVCYRLYGRRNKSNHPILL
jgi:hypothetical protein